MLKVVIDTNVFISGVLVEDGIPSMVLKVWKRTLKYRLFITEEAIQEILKVMARLNISANIIGEWENVIRRDAIQVKPKRKIEAVREDTSDNKFLECAVECQADYIVTGDKHLQNLSEFEGIKIVNARKFLDILARYKE